MPEIPAPITTAFFIVDANSNNLSSLLAVRIRFAPNSFNLLAKVSPIPDEAPVTNTTSFPTFDRCNKPSAVE